MAVPFFIPFSLCVAVSHATCCNCSYCCCICSSQLFYYHYYQHTHWTSTVKQKGLHSLRSAITSRRPYNSLPPATTLPQEFYCAVGDSLVLFAYIRTYSLATFVVRQQWQWQLQCFNWLRWRRKVCNNLRHGLSDVRWWALHFRHF